MQAFRLFDGFFSESRRHVAASLLHYTPLMSFSAFAFFLRQLSFRNSRFQRVTLSSSTSFRFDVERRRVFIAAARLRITIRLHFSRAQPSFRFARRSSSVSHAPAETPMLSAAISQPATRRRFQQAIEFHGCRHFHASGDFRRTVGFKE
jgi:hypothetical protein